MARDEPGRAPTLRGDPRLGAKSSPPEGAPDSTMTAGLMGRLPKLSLAGWRRGRNRLSPQRGAKSQSRHPFNPPGAVLSGITRRPRPNLRTGVVSRVAPPVGGTSEALPGGIGGIPASPLGSLPRRATFGQRGCIRRRGPTPQSGGLGPATSPPRRVGAGVQWRQAEVEGWTRDTWRPNPAYWGSQGETAVSLNTGWRGASSMNFSTGSSPLASKNGAVTRALRRYCWRTGPAVAGATSSAWSVSDRPPWRSAIWGWARTL